MPDSNSFPILVVEDSDDDLFLFRRLLSKAGIAHPLNVATNGQAAIEQLTASLRGPADELPHLIFLDLKLPLRSGFEVLQWIRSQSALRELVVIVLSSSAEARDVKRAYEVGAQGYLVKYPQASVFREVIDLVVARRKGSPGVSPPFPGVARP